jgi:flagellar hook-associated protein 3 FlgL
MTLKTIGTLLLPTRLQGAITQTRHQIGTASTELATGRVAETRTHLRGNLAPLAQIEARIARLDGLGRLMSAHAQTLDLAQLAMGRIGASGLGFASAMRAAVGLDPATIAPAEIAGTARAALEDMVAALSVSAAGRAVFAGTASDTSPLPGAAQIMAALLPTLAGLSEATDISAAVTSFFEAPGGGFETLVYQGGPPAPGLALSDGETAPQPPTAAEPALRRQLGALTLAAVTGEGALALDQATVRTLALQAADRAQGNSGALAALQGRIGQGQAALARAADNYLAERDGATLARDALIGTDPFAAAARLEQGRVQLESLYAVTARLSSLTLTRFLS